MQQPYGLACNIEPLPVFRHRRDLMIGGKMHSKRTVKSDGWTGIVLGLAVFAPTPSSVMAAPLGYECDAPAGHFSEVSQAAAGQNLSVTGTISANEVRRGGDFGPTAGVRIVGADGKQVLVLRIVTPTGEKRPCGGNFLFETEIRARLWISDRYRDSLRYLSN